MMEVLISHDIDHITVTEHYKDLIVPKYLARNTIELFLGYLPVKQYTMRFTELFTNKWQQIDELMDFDEDKGVPATFFVGTNNGLGLSYSIKQAEKWIKRIIKRGFEVGVHGIAFDNYQAIEREFKIFKTISGLNDFGIRMHYIRNNANTLEFLNKAGYIYDSTIYALKDPYKVNNMWEFPFHIMDGYVICGNQRWQTRTFKQVKENTKKIIEQAHNGNLQYLNILFHDRYFHDSFGIWKDWYMWLIDWLKENNFRFINYKTAIKSLQNTG